MRIMIAGMRRVEEVETRRNEYTSVLAVLHSDGWLQTGLSYKYHN